MKFENHVAHILLNCHGFPRFEATEISRQKKGEIVGKLTVCPWLACVHPVTNAQGMFGEHARRVERGFSST